MPTRPIDLALKVVDNVDAMLGYWNRDLRCCFANAAYRTWFGRSRQEMMGISMEDLWGPLFALNLPHIQGALAGEVQVFEREIRLPDGTVRHGLASYYPDVVNGEVLGFSAQMTDVTRLKRLEFELVAAREQAEFLAMHDFLTGLPNRLLLMERIAAAMLDVERRGGILGIVAVDMDGFKEINDTYGHGVGDEVLKEVARRMKEAVRSTDAVTRLGGDEFIYLITDAETEADVEVAARRLQEMVARPMELQEIQFKPRLSCGISIYPRHGRDAETLLSVADKALFLAKRQGKHCSVFAD